MALSDTDWVVILGVVLLGVSTTWYRYSIARAKRRNKAVACARCGRPLAAEGKPLGMDQFVKVRTCEACAVAVHRNYRSAILALVLVALVMFVLAVTNA
jgi:hypothetical protein